MGDYPWLGYADDMILTAMSQSQLQSAADLLSELLGIFGLVISIDKTKTMILNFNGTDYPSSIVNINGNAIENVLEFIYLGALITNMYPGTSDKELSRRIGMANSKFSSLKKLLCNYHIKLSIRVRFYEVYIRSRLCYCCETWTLTVKQMNHIESAHIQLLRRMIRGGMERRSSKQDIKAAKKGEDIEINWAWKFTNEIILSISKSPSLTTFIPKQNLKWVAHICRAPNESLTKQLMFTDEKYVKIGRRPKTVLENVLDRQSEFKSPETFLRECFERKV